MSPVGRVGCCCRPPDPSAATRWRPRCLRGQEGGPVRRRSAPTATDAGIPRKPFLSIAKGAFPYYVWTSPRPRSETRPIKVGWRSRRARLQWCLKTPAHPSVKRWDGHDGPLRGHPDVTHVPHSSSVRAESKWTPSHRASGSAWRRTRRGPLPEVLTSRDLPGARTHRADCKRPWCTAGSLCPSPHRSCPGR